ncbi:Anaphase-promoting complex, subunit 15/MND2 [Metarhizium album ARSEF 1941]|uniref:Anaphase-promoting complex, subunit 15/MND2 n=1 Tax=Metarhizium album (strain ARSEF 1941) TaxID=1081103 RepID=A0A0B2WXG9_METAS|nr:Anaphase-promoting complex, subunit 15/MND2 [Metarhizium album ARSEF 1941]KHN98244.1 Anaphase-promoting complex, subunit 15/MND2 [Metarhizium album ARSEF 1941]
MLTTLPDFTPRDSHSLWYTSSRGTSQPPGLHDTHHGDSLQHNHSSGQSRPRGHVVERTALARLAASEQLMHRRRIQVQNFGSGWLRPPGVPKTLHQMREEKREQEEHHEAMRREQLAQELAEAEGGGLPGEGMMDDVQLDGAHDLDDEIPDADNHFGMGDEDEDDDDQDEEEGIEAGRSEELDDEALREERQNDLMAARMRMADDAFREALVRGDPDGDDMYGGGEELEQEHQGHMLDEEDFAHDGTETNLDDDIPEAESGLYEHTDSEAELSSSDDGGREDEQDEHDAGFVPRTAQMAPPLSSPTSRGRRGSGRNSMDLSNILSQDESSFMDSSPVQRRRHA